MIAHRAPLPRDAAPPVDLDRKFLMGTVREADPDAVAFLAVGRDIFSTLGSTGDGVEVIVYEPILIIGDEIVSMEAPPC